MTPELRSLIDQSRWCRGTVQAVAALLPADDAELDRVIGEVVSGQELLGFLYVATAATSAGRPVDARHLRLGTRLLTLDMLYGSIAVRAHGDLVDAVLDADQQTILVQTVKAMGFFAAAAWWRRHHEGQPFPSRLLAGARTFVRADLPVAPLGTLCAMAAVTGDEVLLKIATEGMPSYSPARQDPKSAPAKAKKLSESMEAALYGPILDLVPEAPPHAIGMGGKGPLRRSVARIGRNELCPCGSGKKYKHCCEAADRERLRLSTDVAGKTYAEIRADPERYLTAERLERALAPDVARYDPLKVPRELVPRYIERLADFKYCDRATEAFEQIGWSPELKPVWDIVAFMAGMDRRRDLLERLVAVRGPRDEIVENLEADACLLLAENDPVEKLRLLEEIATIILRTTDSEGLLGISYRVLFGEKSALSVMFARSVIPLIEKKDALHLIHPIQLVRDRLDLPSDDPFVELIERRYGEETDSHGEDAAALRAALERVEAKATEVRLLQARLDVLRREIEDREKGSITSAPAVSNATSPAAPTASASDAQALDDLRRKVETLKGHLKERHAERTTLRQELEKAHADMEKLRAAREAAGNRGSGGAAPSSGARDSDEDLTLPGEVEGNQPLRTIEFPRKFNETLESLPRAMGRGALVLLGRLAAGESAAFHGVVRLKAAPDVVRARIGIDHRLLFRLLADRIEVVDLINRRDLERRIKTLG